jgi:transposase
MMLIGVDYHPSFQQIAFFVEDTGECGEQQLNHSEGEAERFYRDLRERGIRVRVGMEATGYARWFERLLAALGIELWIGDPTIADGILDRLVHNAHRIEMRGESMRKKRNPPQDEKKE